MRTEDSLKNITTGILGQLLFTILKVAARASFVFSLGSGYLGLNGLFTNVISILNITELGLSNAIVFALYKPIAEKDYSKISALMRLYKKSYTIIGWVIFLLGLLLMPFLPYIVNLEPGQAIVNTNLVYLFFLLETVTSYWFFEHKKSFLFAAQKNYIVNGFEYLFKTIFTVLQIVVIVFFTNVSKEYRFYAYSLIGIVGNIGSKFVIRWYADRHYPHQKEYHNEKLTEEDKKSILKNVSALSLYKICTKITNSITSILVSALLKGGTILVGIYSNYTMITSVVDTCLLAVTKGISASIGDFYAAESRQKSERLYQSTALVFAWLYGMASVCLLLLVNPFLLLVFGQDYVLSDVTLLIIVANFWVVGQTRAANSFRNAAGLYWKGKLRPVANVIINLVSAVLLSERFGLDGILLGVLLGNAATLLWYEPWLVYTKAFQMSPMPCFRKSLKYNAVVIVSCILVVAIGRYLPMQSWLGLILRGIMCVAITFAIFFVSSCRTQEFIYVKNKFTSVLLKIRRGAAG